MSEDAAIDGEKEEREVGGAVPSASFSRHEEIGRAVSHTAETGVFFGSLMAGLLLGMLGDHLLDTRPTFIVLGIIAGSVIGFWRMWHLISGEDRRGH